MKLKHKIVNTDCLSYLIKNPLGKPWTTIFADPPDNFGLSYGEYDDKLEENKYIHWLRRCLRTFVANASTVWLSYNAKWNSEIGTIVSYLLDDFFELRAKLCVQTFTFGQHNQHDLGSGFRPLLRLQWKGATLLPNAIRVLSWRQQHGDKRASPCGKVPGDVFDFPRVTGNSKQRRSWCPTQLHEGLVERCIRLTTPIGEPVLDPFGGTGTTLRVCKRTMNPCTIIEMDANYCAHIAAEHELKVTTK